MSKQRSRLAAGSLLAVVTVAIAVGSATPAQAIPGMVFRTATSATDSVADKTQSTAGPPGTRALAGGAFINGGGHQVLIMSMRPVTTPAGDSFEAMASEQIRPIYTGNWSLVAYAICGAAPAGLEYVSA